MEMEIPENGGPSEWRADTRPNTEDDICGSLFTRAGWLQLVVCVCGLIITVCGL